MARPHLKPPTPGAGTRPLTPSEMACLGPQCARIAKVTMLRVGRHPIPTDPALWASPAVAKHGPSRLYAQNQPPPKAPDGTPYFVHFPTARRRPRLPAFGLPPQMHKTEAEAVALFAAVPALNDPGHPLRDIATKQCVQCLRTKPRRAFDHSPRSQDGRTSSCHTCRHPTSAATQKKQPTAAQAAAHHILELAARRVRHEITAEDHHAQLEQITKQCDAQGITEEVKAAIRRQSLPTFK